MHYNITIPRATVTVVSLFPRTGNQIGGTDVRITVTGMLIPDVTSPTSIPTVTFGLAPAESTSVLVSDMDATILVARTPQSLTAGVVTVLVAGEGNATFAYMSAGVSAVCVSRVCEVDAVTGGTLLFRVGGLGTLTVPTVKCNVNGMACTAKSTRAESEFFELALSIPGMGTPPDEPLTAAFMSLSSTQGSAVVFTDVYYRSPPRVVSAEFTGDGSRIDVKFDQRTNATGSAVSCDRFMTTGGLGERATCSWDAERQTITAMLGKGASIVVGDTLTIFAGIVRSLNGVSSANSPANALGQMVVVAAPAVVLPPRCVTIYIYIYIY